MSLISEISQLQDEIREGYMPEKKTAPDFGEPWRDQTGCVRDRMYFFVSLKPPETVSRVIACVNACAGMADPSAEIAELRRNLGAARGERDRNRVESQAMRVAIKEAHEALKELRSFYLDMTGLPPCAASAALAKLQPFIKP